ncbi:MAG: hypothetical protein N5P05_000608 [Chroococcopsis gigantea SAG 12.99]|jgi:predicted transposase/invertase (TIGR01784 family)|nr:hypothetical protein [Chroococcopsis gigantea SAG 12.99]
MYDPICKFLAENYSGDFARWLLGKEMGFTRLSPSELSLEPIRADALILLQSEREILHIEFQTQPDPKMGFRMLDYRLRVYRRFPGKLMRQVVIYLKKTPSALVEQRVFQLETTRHEYEIIKMWEVEPTALINETGLLPLVVLGNTANPVDTLAEVARKIEAIENSQDKSNISASTAVLAGLILERETIKRILREDIMKESVIYQEWIETATAEGMARGRAEGRAEGLKEGEAKLILKQLDRRIGNIPESLIGRIQNLSLEQLEELGETLLDFRDLESLITWLGANDETL